MRKVVILALVLGLAGVVIYQNGKVRRMRQFDETLIQLCEKGLDLTTATLTQHEKAKDLVGFFSGEATTKLKALPAPDLEYRARQFGRLGNLCTQLPAAYEKDPMSVMSQQSLGRLQNELADIATCVRDGKRSAEDVW